MKETLEIVKQNALSALFATLFGWSVGLNIKQYKDSQNDAEYIKDIHNVLNKSIEANDSLFNCFNTSIIIIKNDSINIEKKFKDDSEKALDKLIESKRSIIKFIKKYN